MMLTPVEQRGDFFFKRDDLFSIPGIPVTGAKVRAIWALARDARGLVSAGSRHSPHVHRVAAVAAHLGVPCRLHIATGANTPNVQAAQVLGAEIIRYRAGYLSVLNARAREDAQSSSYTLIPFGVVCPESVAQIRAQVANVPHNVRRLVIAVGSGTSLSGVLCGLQDQGLHIPVLGVCVGKDPTHTLDCYAPPGWRDQVELVRSSLRYEQSAEETSLAGVILNPIYEAKCLPWIQSGDLLWIIG